MNKLRPVREVALREIKERGRSRAYLLTSIFTLLLVVGIVVIPTFIDGGTTEGTVGSVGEGNSTIVDAAELIGNAGDDPAGEPSYTLDTTEYATREEGESALENGEIEALLVDAREVVTEGSGGFGGSSLVNLLQRGAASLELERLVAEQGEAAAEVIDIMTSDPLELSSVSGDEPIDESQGLVAYAGLMLLYVAILLYGTWILTGVTEEKTNRVVEVLLSSVRPWQLLGGKIAGIGTLGLLQFGLTIGIAAFAISLTGVFELPELALVSVLNLVLWFILGFLLFAVLFAAAGSLVSRMEDAQTSAMPMTLLAVAGLFVAITALDNPDGLVAIIGSYVPLTSPFVVPVRAALGGIAAWEYVLAVLVTLGSIVFFLFVAGRIYSGGLLQFGGKIKIKDAWRSANG